MGTEWSKRGILAGPDVEVTDVNGNTSKLLNPMHTNRVLRREDFGQYNGDLKALADTAANFTTPGGFRVFGQGLTEAADSGILAITDAPGQRFSTTDEAAHTIAIGTGVMLQPDAQGPFRYSAAISFNNIATKSVFMGFAGSAADALDPRVTGATTVLTLVDNDLGAIYWDANMTDVDRWFVPHNKANEAATIATTAAGVDTGKNIVAASMTILNVEVDALGNLFWSINDAAGYAAGNIALALDPTQEHAAVLYVAADGAAIEEMDIHAVELEYFHDNNLV